MTLKVEWEGRAISGNRRLAVGRGRIYSRRQYKAFIQDLALTIRAQAGRKRFPGAVRVDLELEIPPRMDTDAVVKPCYDAVQASGIVRDDNLINHGTQQRTGAARKTISRITLLISELRPAAAGTA